MARIAAAAAGSRACPRRCWPAASSRMRAVQQMRPDLGLFRMARGCGASGTTRCCARWPTSSRRRGSASSRRPSCSRSCCAPAGHLRGPAARRRAGSGTSRWARRWRRALGRADVGQTVVVKNGHVLALEAVEGTDACIRRGARARRSRGGGGEAAQAGAGRAVRFAGGRARDARGACAEVGARVLAVEAGKTLLLEGSGFSRWRTSAESRSSRDPARRDGRRSGSAPGERRRAVLTGRAPSGRPARCRRAPGAQEPRDRERSWRDQGSYLTTFGNWLRNFLNLSGSDRAPARNDGNASGAASR